MKDIGPVTLVQMIQHLPPSGEKGDDIGSYLPQPFWPRQGPRNVASLGFRLTRGGDKSRLVLAADIGPQRRAQGDATAQNAEVLESDMPLVRIAGKSDSEGERGGVADEHDPYRRLG